jgi:hypothetical protein
MEKNTVSKMYRSEIVQEKRMLIKTIRDRQRDWVGHVWRGPTPANGMAGMDGEEEGGRKTRHR